MSDSETETSSMASFKTVSSEKSTFCNVVEVVVDLCQGGEAMHALGLGLKPPGALGKALGLAVALELGLKTARYFGTGLALGRKK